MSTIINTHNRVVTGIGTGATVDAKLYQNGSFVKTLKTAVATTNATPFSITVNTETSAGTDFIAPGSNYTIKLDDGVNPEVPAEPQNFTVANSHLEDFPTIGWFGGGSVFAACSGVANDAAGIIPAELFVVDAVAGVVGNVLAGTSAGSAVAVTMSQPTSAWKSPYRLDAQGFPYIDVWDSAGQGIEVAPVSTITNGSFIECTYVLSALLTSTSTSWFSRLLNGVTLRGNGTPNVSVAYGIGNATFASSTKTTIRVKHSASAVFGDSEVYINNVLAFTTATYLAAVTTTPQKLGSLNGPGPRISFYAGMFHHETALTPAEVALVETWGKDRAGIV